MRLLRAGVILIALAAGVTSAGCWGDNVPALDQIGALRADNGQVVVLFGACPGETVERVELRLTDDDFEEIIRVLWSVEADKGSSVSSLTVGEVPVGFRELIALDEPLKSSDDVQLVVTSSLRTIPMSFTVGNLRSTEVLVRQDHYRSRVEFDERVDERCRRRR